MNDTSPHATRPWQHAAAIVLLALALALLYAQVRQHGYIDWDDTSYVSENRVVREGLGAAGVAWAFTTVHMSNWHPLTWLSHMLDVSLFGLDPGPQHLVNAALHGFNSALVYALIVAYLRRVDAALLAALVFLAHPQHVESVAWIAERKDLLCALFYLLALLAYRRWVRAPGAANYLLLTLCFVLALLAKPMAVSLPAVLLVLDFWPLQRLHGGTASGWIRRAWPLLREKLPLVALSAAACVVTVHAQHAGGAISALEELTLAERLQNAAVAVALYLRDFVLPTRLAVIYPIHPLDPLREVLPAALLLAALGAAAIALRRRQPAVLAGLAWLGITLLPVLGIVQVGIQSRADRYMYLPSIGLLLILAALLPGTRDARRRVLIVLLPWLAFLGALCYLQLGYWENRAALFERAVRVTKDNFFAHLSLSDALLEDSQFEEAGQHAAIALALRPDRYLTHQAMGNVRLANQDYAGAERHYRQALALAPEEYGVMNNLAVALVRQQRLREARELLLAAVAQNPDATMARKNLQRIDCPPEPAAPCELRSP